MKQLIPMDEYGVFCDNKDTARANSLLVAKIFGKRHADVLRSIETILQPDEGLSEEFRQRNFALSSYRSEQNKKLPCYNLTRDGFTLLVMGFTGPKAMRFKEAYIRRFNEMEKLILSVVTVRKDYPLLTEAVRMAHEAPKPYHFSNEADLLNRIITGQSAKEFRKTHGIPKGESIRPYLTQEQIDLMEILQKVDTGLLVSTPDYGQRKKYLEWYKMKHQEAKLPKQAS